MEEKVVEIEPELQSLFPIIFGTIFGGITGGVSHQGVALEITMKIRDAARSSDAMARVVLAVSRPGPDVVDRLSWRSCLSRQRRLCQNHGKEWYDRANGAPCNLPGSTVQEPREQLSPRGYSEREN